MKESLEKQLIRHEGLRLKPYHDSVGKLTIGVGRCLETNPLTTGEIDYLGREDLSDGITEEEALYLLKNDIGKCREAFRDNFTFFDSLSEVRRNVVIDMCFNLGISGLKKFVNTLKAIENEEYDKAADMMLQSKWAQQVKSRANELSEQMREG